MVVDQTGKLRRPLAAASGLTGRARGRLFAVALVAGCSDHSAVLPDTGEAADALRVCPRAMTVPGIDVSMYQQRVDWAQAAASGIAFGIARISDGLVHDDATFETNWAEMKAAGLVRGAYQYFEPSEDPGAQADRVVAKVGRLGPGDLPVALDVEAGDGAASGEIVRRMKIWMDTVTRGTGKRPLVYTARYFWDSEVTRADFGSYPLWVASYGGPCPDLPDAWKEWRFWQNGSTGPIPGVGVSVDHDVFDGTLAELRAFAGIVPDRADGGRPDASELPGDASAAGTDGGGFSGEKVRATEDAAPAQRDSSAPPSNVEARDRDSQPPSGVKEERDRTAPQAPSCPAPPSLSPAGGVPGEASARPPGCTCHAGAGSSRPGGGDARLLVLPLLAFLRRRRRDVRRGLRWLR